MAVMGFNPAAEMTQVRTQRTLAMEAAAPAAAAAPAGAVDPAAAAAAGAAAPGAAADAAIGAAAVQEPPSTSKIVLQSVLKGAVSGASLSLGLKQFGPMLGKVGFLKNIIGTLPKGVPPVGTGVLGFLGKLPVVGMVATKFVRATGMQGLLIAAAIGAGVGAIFGALTGLKKAKAAAAEYAEAMAAQQAQQPTGDPMAPAPGAEPAPAPAPAAPKYRSWIIAREGTVGKTGGSFGHYKARKGDTLEQLAKRFHTTPAEIKKLNPGIGSTIEPGTKLKLKRKVVKDAARWRG